MTSLADSLEKLRRIDSERGPKYVADFEAVLADIAALRDAGCVAELARFFDDAAPFDELMFSIIHTIEIFDDKAYVGGLLSIAPMLCAQAPRWASIVFVRALNSEPTRRELVAQLRGAPTATKSAVRDLMQKINARSPEFLAKTTVVIVATT